MMESASNHGKECSNETIADIDNRAEDNSVGKISFACHTLNTFGSKKAKKVLAADFEPNEYTVILGRGSSTDSPGHRHLRLVVQSYLQQYLDAPDKLGKSLIVSRVYDTVKKGSPAAAFVKFNNGTWVDVGERTSREKIGSLFRDCLSNKYKSSSKNKTAIREQKKRAKQLEAKGKPTAAPATLKPPPRGNGDSAASSAPNAEAAAYGMPPPSGDSMPFMGNFFFH